MKLCCMFGLLAAAPLHYVWLLIALSVSKLQSTLLGIFTLWEGWEFIAGFMLTHWCSEYL